MLFESLLANNVKFNALNEIITFITNIVHEGPNRKFDDTLILDRNITREECFFKVMNTVDPVIWIPTEKEMMLVWERVQSLSQEDLNRIYYKNNLYTFCDLPIITDLITKILCKLDGPFMNPNKPPKNIIDDLDILVGFIKEYVYYRYPYIDKLDRIEYMQRDIVAVSDTDSCIISFDGWYRFILDKVYNVPMKIKRERFRMYEVIEEDEFGDRPKKLMTEPVEPILDYNFYTDEVIEIHKMATPAKLIPQDTLRYAILNIIAYICSALIIDYLDYYCTLTNSMKQKTRCVMIMKNEYTFNSALLTDNRRNYASVQVLQEGNIIPDKQSARLGIAGMPINKSTLGAGIKKKLQDILYEDIMTADNIDQVKIMKHLVFVEKSIIKSINNKETTYYKPDNIAAVGSYSKNPLEVNGIVAAMIYNELRTDDMSPINLNERNKIFKIKLNVTRANLERIKDDYPEVYEKFNKLMQHPTLGAKLGTIGFPEGDPVPDWILPFVDVSTIVNDNLKNFPLDSIGLKRLDNDNVNYSNIIQL